MEKKGCCIFAREEYEELSNGLQLAQCMLRGRTPALDPDTMSPEVTKQLEDLVVADAHSCSCCSVKFPNPTAQRAHFKLDWHRYNIKRQLAGLSSVPEEAFTALADRGDDIESISGSESESETEGDKNDNSELVPSRHAKVFFRNNKDQVVSLYYCLLSSSKERPEPDTLVNEALNLRCQNKWAIIMLGGGHFAAAIFEGQEAIVHKTFHCYTVRAKQGGSQSTRDSRGGNHPKSAGASLRRYNEQQLVQHVQELISTWGDHFNSCNLIFYRAVGPNNRSVLFGGKNPPLDKTDSRLRTIPFPTRRATYNEVQRVHGILSFIEVHGLETEFQANYPPSPERKYVAAKEEKGSGKYSEEVEEVPRSRSKVKGGIKPNRAKSRPSPQRPLPANLSRPTSESEKASEDENAIGGGGSDGSLTCQEVEISFKDNVENFDLMIKNETKKKKEKVKQRKLSAASYVLLDNRSKEDVEREELAKAKDAEKKQKIAEKKARKKAVAELKKKQEDEEAFSPLTIFQKELLGAIQSGDVSRLQTCLSPAFIQSLPSELPGGLDRILNLPIAEGNNTALHVASRSGATSMISELMACGADPSTWNKKCQTPFGVSATKDIRKAFQNFRIEHPDKFDYSKSLIPLPLTEEEEREIAERKAAQKKAKKDREKAKLKAKAEEKLEREEKERFMAMSDRDKRALAAERRILAAQRRGTVDEGKKLVLLRCFVCGSDISGQATFEYNHNKFCSVECLRVHRMQENSDLKRI
ncbi:ankyrin repeat and zinc finger domain-containing protein 1 [Frankliniella occidentalis]|uniref:Ankyrin repeat and zinc finger domain-containing protein 1 n=1 Tax=Frankliniella occidentalis TaxID=133901 RepID=A0A6J1SD80_FRAOC|nr:ankyrin repeat and zinc finger domain-containing protein 1 [Frankliniella occidentalis]